MEAFNNLSQEFRNVRSFKIGQESKMSRLKNVDTCFQLLATSYIGVMFERL